MVSKLDSKLIDMVLSLGVSEGECEIVVFEDHAGNRQRQAISVAKQDPSIRIVFTLPGRREGAVFITATDGDVLLTRKVLAHLETASRDYGLQVGNVVQLRDPELAARCIDGVVLLPPDVSNLFSELPSVLKIDDQRLPIHLVVFLTREDHARWIESGHDGLMDYFSEIDKDLISLGVGRMAE